MEESNSRYWDLIAKHLQGEASKQEEADLFAWVHAKPENQTSFDKAKAAWKFTEQPNDIYSPNIEKGWKQFQQKANLSPQIHQLNHKQPDINGKTIHFRPWPMLMKVAAAFVIVIGLAYLANIYLSKENEMLAFDTQNQKKSLTLPDGSSVVLNRNSTLSYDSDFNEEGRIVYLTGEAFFDVKKASGKTFTIYSGNTKTQVLGTSFTVRSYKNEGKTEVQVLTGKVAFSKVDSSRKDNPQQESVLLTPGYKAVMQTDDKIVKMQMNDPNFIAWKDNRLTFSNTRMDKVIASLEDYFEVPIQVTDAQLLECRFTGTFEDPTLQEIVDVLVVSVDLTYSRKDSQYIFSGRGCR